MKSKAERLPHFHAYTSAGNVAPKETTYRTRAGAVAMVDTLKKVAKSFGFKYEVQNGVLRVHEASGEVVTSFVMECEEDCEVRP